MRVSVRSLSFVALLLVAALSASAQFRIHPDNLAPFVPTPELVVDKMLEAAELQPNETLYDLGCGDGRILFAAAGKFKAKAVGVELSERLVKSTTARAEMLGLSDRVSVIEGNLLDVDLSPADVVSIYLLRLSNERLKPNLKKHLKPGARVVSHDYEIMGWKPYRVERVLVLQRPHVIYVYKMPPVDQQ
ncbi:MAG: class I SAM-dependent methyltransferase [Bryobacteraceae bacterium]